MEHLRDWLTVLASKAHLPLMIGMYIKLDQRKEGFLDSEPMGDNLPHVFLRADSLRRSER